jgi:hypothetical protein
MKNYTVADLVQYGTRKLNNLKQEHLHSIEYWTNVQNTSSDNRMVDAADMFIWTAQTFVNAIDRELQTRA